MVLVRYHLDLEAQCDSDCTAPYINEYGYIVLRYNKLSDWRSLNLCHGQAPSKYETE